MTQPILSVELLEFKREYRILIPSGSLICAFNFSDFQIEKTIFVLKLLVFDVSEDLRGLIRAILSFMNSFTRITFK